MTAALSVAALGRAPSSAGFSAVPEPGDVLLIVEVADFSPRYDRLIKSTPTPQTITEAQSSALARADALAIPLCNAILYGSRAA